MLKQNKTTHFHFFYWMRYCGYIFASIWQQTYTVHEEKMHQESLFKQKIDKNINKRIFCPNFTSVHFHSFKDTDDTIHVYWSSYKITHSFLKGRKIYIRNCLQYIRHWKSVNWKVQKKRFHAIFIFIKTHISKLHMKGHKNSINFAQNKLKIKLHIKILENTWNTRINEKLQIKIAQTTFQFAWTAERRQDIIMEERFK